MSRDLVLTLDRGLSTDQGTPGVLSTLGFSVLTLELPWRDNATNVSSIPAGDYPIEFVKARRSFSGFRWLYWVKDVPGRSGILIHVGNFAGDRALGLRTDSWGCILPGLRMGALGGQTAVLASRSALIRFHSMARRRSGRLIVNDYLEAAEAA